MQSVAARVFQGDKFGLRRVDIQTTQADITAHAVLCMHDRRTFAKIREIVDQALGILHPASASAALGGLTEQFRLRQDGQATVSVDEAVTQRRNHQARGQGAVLKVMPVAEFGARPACRPEGVQQQFPPAR